MSWFQLDPQSLADRARTGGSTFPSLGASLGRGVAGFTLVSVAGFLPWALGGHALRHAVGEAGLYTLCALVFMGLSGPLLHGLIMGPGSLGRFLQLFSMAFAAYSAAWMAGWMSLRGPLGSDLAGVAGLLAGTAVMGWMFAMAFAARAALLRIIAALFLLNTAGYFLGGFFEGFLIRPHPLAAKLLWGVCYGAGFGAGLGLAFYFCQAQARALWRGEHSA